MERYGKVRSGWVRRVLAWHGGRGEERQGGVGFGVAVVERRGKIGRGEARRSRYVWVWSGLVRFGSAGFGVAV